MSGSGSGQRQRQRGGSVSTELVGVRRLGTTCVLTLQREAKLNALSTEVEAALAAALLSSEALSSACVVISGGEHVFSAGADLDEGVADDPAAILAYYRATGGVYEQVANLRQPTISAISGYCLGGGLELALATDFRVADATAVFALPEVQIGIVPSSGGTHRLVRLLGTARALELVLLGDRIGAEEAYRIGLVTRRVAKGQALEQALELAERIAQQPPLAVAVAKEAVLRMPESSRDSALLIERLAYGLLAQTADAAEAAAARAQRRPPRFEGR